MSGQEMMRPEQSSVKADVYYGYISKPCAEVHRLRAEVRVLREQGYVAPGPYTLVDDGKRVTAIVQQLRPFPQPMKLSTRIMAWSAMGLGALSGIGYLIWQSRYLIGAGLLLVLGLAVIFDAGNLRSSGSCSGVHVKH